jgi:hypothetical protein
MYKHADVEASLKDVHAPDQKFREYLAGANAKTVQPVICPKEHKVAYSEFQYKHTEYQKFG